MSTTARSLILALVLAAGLPAVAHAQEGGGGRILERDLRQGGGGNTPRSSMYREVQMRNALVTGNVGGGASFRGNVGYTAPNEFRGSLGSDSSFSFRRNGASPITNRSVRGGDALRYQMSNTTGSSFGQQSLISRSGPTGRAAAQAPAGSDGVMSGSMAAQRQGFSPLNSSLRSTATFTSGQSLQPSVLSKRDATGERMTVGSSLLGVRELPNAGDASNSLGAPGTGTTRFAEPAARPGEKPELRPGQVQSQVQQLSQPAVTTAATSLVENLSTGTSLTRTVVDELRDRQGKLAQTRAQARADAGTPAAPKEGEASSAPRADTWQERVDALRKKLLPKDGQEMMAAGRMKSPMQTMRASVDEQKEAISKLLDEETVSVLREGAGQTKQFVASGTDAYGEHMTKGQELMGQSRYFDAEERFTRALGVKPGDATAMAGRLHAQLGAGLYLSAGINMRDLFSKNPEVIAMRYTGETIPEAQRLVSVASDLRARIARARDLGAAMSIDEGLLMAYVAWQLGDAGLVNEGLAAAEAADKQKQGLGEDPDALIQVLRKIWLPQQGSGSPAPVPAGNP